MPPGVADPLADPVALALGHRGEDRLRQGPGRRHRPPGPQRRRDDGDRAYAGDARSASSNRDKSWDKPAAASLNTRNC